MLSGITTSLLIILFMAIVGWAYSRRRQQDYLEAANLPLQDNDRSATP